MSDMVRFSSKIFAATFAVATLLHAQDASAPAAKQAYNKVIGAVVSVAPDGKSLVVKPDSGDPATVILDETTSYMQVPPGEKDLRKATRIDLKDVAPGDRVYARSRKVDGQDSTPAVSVIVMSKTEVAQHQEKTAAEWQRRGAAGRIKAIDPAAKTVTISVQARGGAHDLVIQTDPKTTFRRYAPDSVKFADAQPSDFATLAVGNNLRVLGDKNEDGTSIHAEELVSGSFRNLAGTVISVDAANHQIKVNDLQTKKPVTITVNADTNLRKLPQQMAMMIAARARAGAAGSTGAPGALPSGAPAGGSAANQTQSKAQGGPDSKPGFNGPGATTAGGPPSGAAGAGWAGRPGAGGGMDLNRALEQAPEMTLSDLKPGDALMISSTNGSDASRVTAIAVIGGVEPILAAAPSSSGQSALSGAMTLDIGMPQ
jgi:Cu/Ag efflux protein CusF